MDIIRGTAIVLRGNDIDTDRIIPARFLKAVTFAGLEAHVFVDDRAAARETETPHPFDSPVSQNAAILIVNVNFGCGSSREHAPQALQRRGIRAIVGESFAEIFSGNALAIGLACVTAPAADVARLMTAAETGLTVDIDLASLRARAGDLEIAITMPEAARHSLLTGDWDVTGLLLRDYEDVERAAATIPYLSNFAR